MASDDCPQKSATVDMNPAALQYFSQITRDLSPRTISSAAKHHKRDRSRDEMTLVIIAVCVFNAQATSANCISQICRFDRHYF